MNPMFISTESLFNLQNNENGTPIGEKQTDQPQNKQCGNLAQGSPCKNGYITALKNNKNGIDYHCNIGFEVMECNDYFPLLHTLLNANDNDTIYLNIYSYGGMVETGCHIVNAMLNSKANIITRAYGICASIAAVIWCCGKERVVTDNATLMFHMPSGGCFGKTADNEEESRNVQQYFTELLRDITVNLLTEEDLDKIINCRNDVFIPAKVVNERLGLGGMKNE